MAVAGRILQVADDLGTLRDLAELVKDPSAIVKAHETARSQQTLTAEVMERAEAARKAIAQHEGDLQVLKLREDALAKAQAEHDKSISEFAAHIDAETSALAERSNNLMRKEAQQAEREKALQSKERDLAKKQQEHEEAKKDILARVSADGAAIEKSKAANEAEKARLEGVKKELADKAAKLKEIIN